MGFEIKFCSKCKQNKSFDEFPNDKNRMDGKYPYCKNCRNTSYRSNSEYFSKLRRKYREKNPARSIFLHAKRRAIKRGIPFTIVEDDVMVPEFCPVLNIPIVIGVKVFGPGSPTLDRLCPDKGYEPGNVAVISFRANMIKNDASIKELEQVVAWMRERGL